MGGGPERLSVFATSEQKAQGQDLALSGTVSGDEFSEPCT